MKFKLVLILFVFVLLNSTNINTFAETPDINSKNPTYEYILNQKGFDLERINTYYIDKKSFGEILSILFQKEISTHQVPEFGYIFGSDLFQIIETQLGFQTSFIEDYELKKVRALTFPNFFELLDYYYSDILKCHQLSYLQGYLVKNNEKVELYIEGKNTVLLNEFNLFYVDYLSVPVYVVLDGEQIVEIIKQQNNLLFCFSNLHLKREVKGRMFYYDNSEKFMLVEGDQHKINKYYTASNMIFLGNILMNGATANELLLDKEIYLYMGDYKKHLNMIAIAVERIDTYEKNH